MSKTNVKKTTLEDGTPAYVFSYSLDAEEQEVIKNMSEEQKQLLVKQMSVELTAKYNKLLDDEYEKLLFGSVI